MTDRTRRAPGADIEEFHALAEDFNALLGMVQAHEAALRRIEQAGGKLISKTQLWCELQRDWNREKTVPGFADILFAVEGH